MNIIKGIFGQDTHWKLETPTGVSTSRATPGKYYSSSFTTPARTKSILAGHDELARTDSRLPELEGAQTETVEKNDVETDEYEKNCHLPKLGRTLSVDPTFEFDEDAFVNDISLRYNPWSKTILGKNSTVNSR